MCISMKYGPLKNSMKYGGIYRLNCGEKNCVHGTTLFDLCNL